MYRKQKKKNSVIVAVTLAGLAHGASAFAAPTGGEVVRGSASITGDALETLITQTSNKAVINWGSFDISVGEMVKFVQSNSDAIALNRVTGGGGASQILGSLNANGNVFLINPNGIVFGSGAQIDVAGLLATTFDIDNDAFMNGDFQFRQNASSTAVVENSGTITVGDNGFVYLIAPRVNNQGSIVANLGQVRLANDGSYTLDLQGNNLINFTVTPELIAQGVVGEVANAGRITAETVMLGAGAAGQIMSSVVNTGTITAATSLTMAGSSIEQSGTITADSAELTSAGDIITSGSGLVRATNVTLVAETGAGTQTNAIRTETEHLDVTLAGNTGGIYIEEKNGLDSLKVDTANRPVSVGFDETDQNTLRLEFDTDAKLSSTGMVEGKVDFTNRLGGVTLNGVSAHDDLAITAEGNILSDAAQAGSTATANNLYLEVTGAGSTIGREGQALRVDASTLTAHANRGHIVVTDVAGGVALNEVNTGSNDAEDGLRAIIHAQGGSITSANAEATNITASATNLEADGAIGAAGAGHSITTNVNVLNASTQNGAIHVEDQGDSLAVGSVKAREMLVVAGQTMASSASSNASGDITLSDGVTLGNHDVSIQSQGDMVLTGEVSATRNLELTSAQGAIFSGDAALLTGREIDLNAAEQIGVEGGALRIQSNLINAESGNGGVYLAQANGMTVGTIVAGGENNDVSLAASQGDVRLGFINAQDGLVRVESVNGRILDHNADETNIRANLLEMIAKGAIGTASDRLETEVSGLSTQTSDAGAGTFIDNLGALEALTVDTNRGDVRIGNASGDVSFIGASGQLSLEHGPQGYSDLMLDFSNTGGDIALGTINVGDNDIRLSASGGINQGAGGLLTADNATLSAGRNIGAVGQAVTTDVASLDLTASAGDIVVDNISRNILTLNARADGTGEQGNVRVSHDGDLAVGNVTARKAVELSADGVMTDAGTSSGIRVAGEAMSLTAAAIGSTSNPFSTRASGKVELTAHTGGIFLTNLGALTLLDADAAVGAIDLTNNGNVVLNRLNSGGDVRFAVNGLVTDGNGDGINIQGHGLEVAATQFGSVNDAIEMVVDRLVIDTSNGGIYAFNHEQALSLVRARSSGSGSDIKIGAAGDIALGTVQAAGNSVELRSGGAIEDARSSDVTGPNVHAKSLDISAEGGVGAAGGLALDVSYLSASGGSGEVNASNLGAIAVDQSSLVGKGASGVSLVATSITILDNKGGMITMDGGRLTLTATNGSIAFLNQSDTIYLPGGGSITLTALSKSELEGYLGSIIAGNLTTDGGDITLNAESNITIGMLDAVGNSEHGGDILVESRNGVILDGNGSHANIRADHATLIANTPSTRDAELVRDTAIAEFSAKVAEANAKALQLEILEQQLQSYILLVSAAAVQKGLAEYNETTLQYQVDNLTGEVAYAQKVVDALNTTLKAITLTKSALTMVTGGAQAIPFMGDGGAAAVGAGIDLAVAAADTALDSYERYKLAPLTSKLDGLNNQLDQAISTHVDAATNLTTTTTVRDTTQESRDIADLAYFNAVVARDASQQLRRQAVAAYDLNQDIDMSAEKPLGIEANRVDMRTSAGRDLNSGVYLDSQGDLGLGDIASNAVVHVTDVVGDLSIVGEVKSPTSITLQAGGAIQGANGRLIAPELIAVAGNGIGMNQAVNTRVDRLAVDAGGGGARLLNRNDGKALEITTLEHVAGISGNGDITLDSDGDLVLKASIRDTDTDSQHAITLMSGGQIVDANGASRNVEAHRVVASAVKSIELDTSTADLTATVSHSGNITIREYDDIFLNTLAADNVTMSAGSDVVVGSVSADSEEGTVTLAAAGRIDDDQDASTRIHTDHLVMTAGSAIGGTGSHASLSLDTDVNRLTAATQGEVNIQEQDDLLIESLVTSGGNVTVQSVAGSLEVEQVATGIEQDTITLLAHGGINAAGEASINLTAANLALGAGAGIGDRVALNVNAERLEAEGGFGGIEINDHSGNLAIGGVTPNLGHAVLNGLRSAGDIRVAALSGELRIVESVNQQGESIRLLLRAEEREPGGVFLSGATGIVQGADIVSTGGQVRVTSDDGDIDMQSGTQTLAAQSIDYSAGKDLALQRLTAQGGGVTLAAGDDLAQHADITAAGTVKAAVDGRIVMAQGAQTQAGTGIGYTAGKEQVLQTLEAQHGNVSLAAGEGIAQQASVLAHAGSLTARAGTDLIMAQGAVTAASGGIDYSAGRNLTLQQITAQVGDAILGSGGSLMQNADVTAQGAIVAKAGGNLAMAQGTRSVAGNGVTYDAGRDLALQQIDSNAGDVALNAGRNFIQHANVTASLGSVETKAGNDLNMATGTQTMSAGGIAYAAGRDMTLQQLINVAKGVTLDAGRHLTQNGGIVSTQGSVTADAGGVLAQSADITAAGTVQAAADVNTIMAAGTRTSASRGITYVAGNDLSLQQLTSQGGSVALEAGRNIAQNGVVTTGQGGVSVTAGQSIVMAQGSRTGATVTASYAAGNDLHVTEIVANEVALKAAKGGITGESGVLRNVTASRLVSSAANGIGSLVSALKTQVERLSASLSGTGNIHLNEADAVELTRVVNVNGNAQVAAGGTITAQEIRAQNGRVSLNSTGQVRTAEQGIIEASELNVAASRGIDINTQVEKVTLNVTQAGGIKVRETDAIGLTSVTTTQGNTDVSAGGRIGVNHVQVGGAGSLVQLTTGADVVQARPAQSVGSALVGDSVILQAASGIGIGTGGALLIDTDRLVARTQAGNVQVDLASSGVRLDDLSSGQGNITATVRQGDAVVGKVNTGGNVSLSAAEGSLRDDANSATQISGSGVTLAARNGIGGVGASLQTEANSLAATVSGPGDIVIDERTGLSRLNASTVDGDILVRTLNGEMGADRLNARGEGSRVSLQAHNGGIRDANNDSRSNISADQLALVATNGIGRTNNALDIDVSRLVADGSAGGVYLNNLSDALTLGGVQGASLNTMQTRAADVVLTTAGDLSIAGDVVNTGGGDIRLNAQGDVLQVGNVTASRNGDISVAGDGRVEMTPQASTSTGRGDIRYAAGERLAVSHVMTANDLNGGRITLQAPDLTSTAAKPGAVQGGFINLDSPAANTHLLQELVGSAASQSRVSLNNRMVGGKLSNDRSFIDDLLLPSTMSSAKTSGVMAEADLGPFFSIEGLQATTFNSDGQGDMWIFRP